MPKDDSSSAAKSSISKASSDKQMAEFWETHDLADYWDQTEPVDFEVDIRDVKVVPLAESEAARPKLNSSKNNNSKRATIRRRYRRLLQPYAQGGYVKATLNKGENRPTVKNRLARAADELGLSLYFKRTRGSLRFEVRPK